jgi:hypothetical protein
MQKRLLGSDNVFLTDPSCYYYMRGDVCVPLLINGARINQNMCMYCQHSSMICGIIKRYCLQVYK